MGLTVRRVPPEPQLFIGEVVEWKARAISFVPGEKSPFGFLFLTDRRVIFESLATRGKLQRHVEFERSDYRSVDRDSTNWGTSWASGFWQQIVFSLQDGTVFHFALRLADEKVRYLAEKLSKGRA